MKKIMTLALLVMTSLAVMAQEEVYKAEMDMLDAQGEAIVKQYKALMEQDPKSELPTTRAKITAFSQMLDSISDLQVQLIRRIARENKKNQIPVPYIKEAMYELGYEGLKEVLDPKAAYYNNPELERAKKLLAGYESPRQDVQRTDDEGHERQGREPEPMGGQRPICIGRLLGFVVRTL